MSVRQEPAAIVRTRDEVRVQSVADTSDVELVQELIARAADLRAELSPPADRPMVSAKVQEKYSLPAHLFGGIVRDLSLAITHLEDARTRLNAARYRLAGKFSISDAQR